MDLINLLNRLLVGFLLLFVTVVVFGFCWTALTSVTSATASPFSQLTSFQQISYSDSAADGLQSDAVYVSPEIPTQDALTDALHNRIQANDQIAVVVLPAEAKAEAQGNLYGYANELATGLDRPVIMVVATGRDYTATSYDSWLPTDEAQQLLDQAQVNASSTQGILTTFVDNVHTYASKYPEMVAPLPPAPASSPDEGGGLPPLGTAAIVFVVVFAVGVFVASRRKRRAQAEEPQSIQAIAEQLKQQIDYCYERLGGRYRDNRSSAMHTPARHALDNTTKLLERLVVDGSPSAISEAEALVPHLISLNLIVTRYVDIERNPQMYSDSESLKRQGIEAIEGYALFVDNRLKGIGRRNVVDYSIETRMLSAKRYS